MVEKQNIEYKRVWKDEYLKEVCGFANAKGGKIYIGFDDDGNPVNLNNTKKLMEDIPNKISSTLGIVEDVSLHKKNNKEYIVIKVKPSSYGVSYKGEYYLRSGSTNQLLKNIALSEFIYKKTGKTWDSVPVENIKISDLDKEAINIFKQQATNSGRMKTSDLNVGAKQLLTNLNVFDGNKMTRAAVLLFHKNPERVVVGSYIKIGYFNSPADLVYQDEIHGPITKQVDDAIDLIYLKYLKGIISYEKLTRKETYPYPREALREALLNAVAHKNYASLTPIQIKVFPNEITIYNDSLISETFTVKDLLSKHKSIPHNPNIAHVFYRMGYIESWGTGIQKIIKECKALGNIPPKFEIAKNYMGINFFALNYKSVGQRKQKMSVKESKKCRSKKAKNVGQEISLSKEDVIRKCIYNNKKVSKADIAEILGVSEKTVERIMSKMKDVHYVGRGYSGHWEIDK